MNQGGMDGKPVWTTEGGWGTNGELSDPDAQAAYVSRWLILQASAGVQRAYWYMWDMGKDPQAWGGLWDSSGVFEAGIAYGEVYKWLVGATFTKPCSANHDIWTCDLSRPGGQQDRIVWNDSRSYDTSITWKYAVGSQFAKARHLDGQESPVAGGVVSVGSKPVLLEGEVHPK
jgi:hypothetical protein